MDEETKRLKAAIFDHLAAEDAPWQCLAEQHDVAVSELGRAYT